MFTTSTERMLRNGYWAKNTGTQWHRFPPNNTGAALCGRYMPTVSEMDEYLPRRCGKVCRTCQQSQHEVEVACT